jgi:hypothetical protein
MSFKIVITTRTWKVEAFDEVFESQQKTCSKKHLNGWIMFIQSTRDPFCHLKSSIWLVQ